MLQIKLVHRFRDEQAHHVCRTLKNKRGPWLHGDDWLPSHKVLCISIHTRALIPDSKRPTDSCCPAHLKPEANTKNEEAGGGQKELQQYRPVY